LEINRNPPDNESKWILIFIISSQGIYSQFSGRGYTIAEHRQLAHDIFKELIEINTASGNGSTRAAEAMAARLKTAGFPATDIKVIGPDPLHKNLVVRYPGKGKLRPVLFICHLDVVEALPRDWSVDPFTFLEKDGYYYGRGTTDVKGEAADLIAPLSPLRDEVMYPVERITASMWPGINISPVMSTGATDGKYLRRAGIPVYGVSGMFGEMDDVRAHGKDERIGIAAFDGGVEFMYRFIKAITSEEKQ
jgi:acetylornithine deacetylase/succinyl-diaminopimelate desuccinylase-like protein